MAYMNASEITTLSNLLDSCQLNYDLSRNFYHDQPLESFLY
jgi:hypothetical protein